MDLINRKMTDKRLNYVSEKENIPIGWLYTNNNHIGINIPEYIIPGGFTNPEAFHLPEPIYYYAGYDMVHQLSPLKNFFYDTKENIINYLRESFEYEEGTPQEEIEEHLEAMFECYTTHKPQNN